MIACSTASATASPAPGRRPLPPPRRSQLLQPLDRRSQVVARETPADAVRGRRTVRTDDLPQHVAEQLLRALGASAMSTPRRPRRAVTIGTSSGRSDRSTPTSDCSLSRRSSAIWRSLNGISSSRAPGGGCCLRAGRRCSAAAAASALANASAEASATALPCPKTRPKAVAATQPAAAAASSPRRAGHRGTTSAST